MKSRPTGNGFSDRNRFPALAGGVAETLQKRRCLRGGSYSGRDGSEVIYNRRVLMLPGRRDILTVKSDIVPALAYGAGAG
jgi:hypothetical protein